MTHPADDSFSRREGAGVSASKKALSVILEEAELIELVRLLMDDDAEAALAFLKLHFKGRAKDLLEGG